MFIEETGTSKFRIRGYVCSNCQKKQHVFGYNDPDPLICLSCGFVAGMSKEWDHEIRQTSDVKDYVGV